MSRPLAAAGLSFFAGCILFGFLGCVVSLYAAIFVGAVCLILTVVYLFFGKNIKLLITVSGFTALALFYCLFCYSARVKPLEKMDGGTYYVSGEIEKINRYTGGTRYIIRSDTITGDVGEEKNCNFTFSYFDFDSVDGRVGDSISGEFTFSLTENTMFGSSWGDGIYLSAECENTYSLSVLSGREKTDINVLTDNIRKIFESRLFCCFDTVSAKITDAMLLGNREYIKDDTRTDFRLAGVSHLLVVSGLHLSICAGFITVLLGLIGVSSRLKNIVSILFVLAFMLISGMGSSVVRAGVMFILCALAKLSGWEYDSLTALSLAALVLLIQNPFAAVSAGFLYSFFATVGIQLFSEDISEKLLKPFSFMKRRRKLYRLIRTCVSLFSVSLSASVMVMPVSMLMGSTGSVFSAVSGVVISLPSSAIISVGMLFAMVPKPFHIVLEPLKILVSLSVKFILWFTSLFSGTAVYGLAYLAPVTAIAIITLILLSVFIMRKARTIAVFLCLAVTVIAMTAEYFYFTGDNSVFLIVCSDSGGYSSAVVEGGKADVYVTDSSTKSDMKTALSYVHCNNVETLTLKSTLSEDKWRDLFPQEMVLYSRKYADTVASQQKILFEMRSGNWDHESCDIFIGFSAQADVSSDFTVIANSDIINPGGLSAGTCVLGNEKSTMIFELTGDSLRILNTFNTFEE